MNGALQNIAHPIIKGILTNNSVQWFARRMPKTYQFLIERLSVEKFTGLPLTGLICAFAGNLLLIMDFTPDVINSKEFVSIDRSVAYWLYSLRKEEVAIFFARVSYLCDPPFIIVLFASSMFILIFLKRFQHIKSLILVLLGTAITIYLSKNVFQVNRPFALAYQNEYSYSFPSGHATSSVAIYGLLFYFIMRRISARAYKILTLIIALSFALFIGFGRLYLCVHYLSDVLAGYMLGSIWLILAIGVFEWELYSQHFNSANLSYPPKMKKSRPN